MVAHRVQKYRTTVWPSLDKGSILKISSENRIPHYDDGQ